MPDHLTRRAFLARSAVVVGLTLLTSRRSEALPPATRITIYKDPNCGCCVNWNAAMRRAGFDIEVRDTANINAVKSSLGVPPELASCHTGVVAGYLFEGHVPPDLVQKVLRERPPLIGLFVPGMPSGSPGMEGPNPDTYDVIALGRDQRRAVYASRVGKSQA